MVCSSSMKRRIRPSLCLISLSTAFRRSSNSPRYLAPASSEPMSSEKTVAVLQPLGHVAAHDALREALDDRRLADAGLADQHRVVLGLARQDLDHPADLGVAADHRVELAAPRLGHQVDAVLLERLVGRLGRGAGHALVAAHLREDGEEALARDAELAQDAARRGRRSPSSIMASSRCSTETYSSLSRLASSSAPHQDLLQPLGEIDLARLGARAGDLGPARRARARPRPRSGSAATSMRASRRGTSPSGCSSRASSRCSPSTSCGRSAAPWSGRSAAPPAISGSAC